MARPEPAEDRRSPRTELVDWLLLVACASLPWLAAGWARPLAGLGLALLWLSLVRPTWRGLAPFFLTALLLANLVALVMVALIC